MSKKFTLLFDTSPDVISKIKDDVTNRIKGVAAGSVAVDVIPTSIGFKLRLTADQDADMAKLMPVLDRFISHAACLGIIT